VLESIEADFDAMSWTFRLQPSNHVSAGNFAVLPVESYALMSRKLATAEGLLRQWLAGHLDDQFRERVQSFFDPEPLG